MLLMDIDGQSENPGMVKFSPNPWGAHALWKKISRGYTVLCFIAFLLTIFPKFGRESHVAYPPYPLNFICYKTH
jgi:hypothetical protein